MFNMMQMGTDGITPASASDWSSFNQGDYQNSVLNPNLYSQLNHKGATMYSPDGRYMIGRADDAPIYSIYDTTQGEGEPIYEYDQNGKFRKTRAGAGVIGQLRGALMVAGAAAGFGALGAQTAGGAAAASGGTGTAAGTGGGSFLGTGTATGGVGYGLGGSTYGGSAIGSGTTFGLGAGGGTLESITQALQNPMVRQAVTTGAKGLMGGGGGSSNGGNMDMGSIFNALGPLVGGATSAARQGQASEKMINWLGNQQERIDKLYAPGSPEYNYMFDEMSRKDAAAGRNSQYGPRSVDMAARIAQIKAENNARLSASFARPYSEALNQDAGKYAGLFGALGNQGGLGNIINMLTRNSNMFSGNNVGSPPNPYYDGGGSFDPGAYDAGYVDPGSVNYTGDFSFPDAGEGDWGPILDAWY